MRIISGKYRGKTIIAPKNLPVRPTTDFAKEALFNLLNNRYYLEELNVLDLFAGTGNISYEFASRGAQSITAVDASHHCVRFIRKTAETLSFDEIEAVKADALQYLDRAYGKWDIVFADPPYDVDFHQNLIDKVIGRNLLAEDGLFVLEHANTMSFDDHPHCTDSRKYGNVHFSFFELDTAE